MVTVVLSVPPCGTVAGDKAAETIISGLLNSCWNSALDLGNSVSEGEQQSLWSPSGGLASK
jgi:hypothetical protein